MLGASAVLAATESAKLAHASGIKTRRSPISRVKPSARLAALSEKFRVMFGAVRTVDRESARFRALSLKKTAIVSRPARESTQVLRLSVMATAIDSAEAKLSLKFAAESEMAADSVSRTSR